MYLNQFHIKDFVEWALSFVNETIMKRFYAFLQQNERRKSQTKFIISLSECFERYRGNQFVFCFSSPIMKLKVFEIPIVIVEAIRPEKNEI